MHPPLHEDLVNEYSLLKDCLALEKRAKVVAKAMLIDDEPFDEEEITELEIYYSLTRSAILWERQAKGMKLTPLQDAMYRKLWRSIKFSQELVEPLCTSMQAVLDINKKLENSYPPEEAPIDEETEAE
jgi:Zn-dependent peptidase ImmA (M78 family)